jgi:pSer/pThr/pTyr-binding forkhead associated (FHA) protein
MFADQTLTEPFAELGTQEPAWLETARQSISVEGDYIAYADSDQMWVVPLRKDWTRIGRSLAADIRFDDPTASRRHALIHREEGIARILDDRSLNGVFLNGERVEWHELQDGDEIVVGRFRLYFVQHALDRFRSESSTGLGQSTG